MNLSIASLRRLEHKWWIFGAVSLGMFVSVLDQTGVNIALPRIADHFDATIPAVQWVSLGYILTIGSLLLPMGRLSDMIGRKRVYVTGFAVFVLGAVLAGSSTTLLGLILFKICQGVGGAMIQANGMAIVTSTFSPTERGKIIGLFITVVGMGAIAGPVLGGVVVSLLDWRYVFFTVAPLGVLSMAAALIVLEGRPATGAGQTDRRPGFDWLGAVLFATAIVVFLLVMTNAYRVGWGSPLVVGACVGVAALVFFFLWWERRAPDPMLALELFKRRLFSIGSSASFLGFLGGASVFFLMPFYLQEVLGYSAGEAGLIIAPSALCMGLAGPIAGRLSDKYGWRRFSILGLVIFGAALLLLSQLSETAPLWLVMLALVMQGGGMGIFYSPTASAVLSTVEKARYGVATAFLNLVRNTGGVAGVGLATTVVTATMASKGYEPSLSAISSGVGDAGLKAAFTQGLQTAFLVMAGCIALAILICFLKGQATAVDTVPAKAGSRTGSDV